MSKTKIYLIRHGETYWNIQNRIQGHSPNSINENGKIQSQKLKERLSGIVFDEIYSSDLPRALHTAQIIFPNKEIKITQSLRERYFGLWEGKTKNEIQSQSPEIFEIYQTKKKLHLSSKGESLNFFRKRILKAITEIAEQNKGKTIAIVTHGGVIKFFYQIIHNFPVEKVREIAFNNTSLNVVEFDSDKKEFNWLVKNDTSHLG